MGCSICWCDTIKLWNFSLGENFPIFRLLIRFGFANLDYATVSSHSSILISMKVYMMYDQTIVKILCRRLFIILQKNLCSEELSPKEVWLQFTQVALDFTEDEINHLQKIVETDGRYFILLTLMSSLAMIVFCWWCKWLDFVNNILLTRVECFLYLWIWLGVISRTSDWLTCSSHMCW